MKASLNLSIIATIIIATLGINTAVAKSSQTIALNNKNVSAINSGNEARLFVNTQTRSLYQIALLSNISISELRELNKGDYDNIDVVNVGDSIILPIDSPLLPVENKSIQKQDKYSHLPALGSSENVDLKQSNSDELERQVATVLQTLGQQDWQNMSSDKLKNDLQGQGQDYAENYARNQVHAQVIDPIRGAAQDFLGRFGTAQLQFDVSDEGHFNNVNVKLFSPWYDSDSTLVFSQLTFQEFEHGRRIGNFGIGQRWDTEDKSWLLGYNVFFDHDFQRAHNRLGLGVEAWADYMKFAANYYHPLSDWKDSRDFDDFLERAAKGFDVRFQGYLPSYPHFGGSLMFEQYFGDKVALFGKDNLQKDPYAVTLGVDYTPVPLFTIKGEHKQGENSNKAAKVELTMNYRLGVPLKDQLDPDMVQVARSLKGSRYDLVDRNNYIVLEYKEKKFSVDLATLGEFEEGQVVPIALSVRNARDGVTITPSSWNSVTGTPDLIALMAADGNVCYNRTGTVCPPGNSATVLTTDKTDNWSILVPSYLDSATGQRNPVLPTAASGRYTLDITLTDGKGRTATSNTSWLAVRPSGERGVTLVNVTTPTGGYGNGSSASPIVANGLESVTLQSNLQDTRRAVGFNDMSVFNSYHPDSSSAPISIDKVNEFWSATKVGSNKVIKFVDGTANNAACDIDNDGKAEECLLVKSIRAISGAPDKYEIEVASTAMTLGQVTVTSKMAPYGEASTDIFFTARASIGYIAIRDITPNSPYANTLVAYGPASGVGVIVANPATLKNPLIVGNQYRAEAYDSDPITNPSANVIAGTNYVWSLVGDNSNACSSPSNHVLPNYSNAANGPWFNVKVPESGDDGAVYVLKGIAQNSLATSSTGLAVAGQSWGASHGPINACAGDQGFAVQITAYYP